MKGKNSMQQRMMKPLVQFLFVCIFVISTLYGGTNQVSASNGSGGNEGGGEVSVADIKLLVEQFANESEFESDQAIHALTLHLLAVSHYEKQDKKNKVIKHMRGFEDLLDHQLENEQISEDAYNKLKDDTNTLIVKLNSLEIVKDGKAKAVVLIDKDADVEITEAVNSFIKYVQKSTGAMLSLMTEEEWQEDEEKDEKDTRIYIGISAPGEENNTGDELEGLDDQGFLIHPREETVTIIGPTKWGTRNGVYDFLERYADIRWLMPGPDGEDVPQITNLTVPREDVREEPAFTHRLLSAGLGDTEWWKQNKLQLGDSRPIDFHHNLYELFPVEKYAETNPEFYPDENPSADGKMNWQPCFTEPGTIDAAVSGILEYFDENPDATSFSLGINDTRNFCETDPNHPDYPDKINSVGDVDMTEIYYEWVNEVVEQVLAVYPDKWFGLLAYNNVTDPPSFSLNPRIVPFITKDRLTWIDEDIRNYGHSQMEEWKQVANQIGWYDYMYGVFFATPRVFPHVMAENFKYASENQVYGHYIEMYHNVGDGPKAWLAAKLMWDPDQDVDALLQEWYERAVGSEAAADLAAYYDLWEDFWTERIQESPYFTNGKTRTYLPITDDASYMNYVTDEDILESQQLLNSVAAKAETPEQQKRAQLHLKMFEYYEASAFSYPRETKPLTNSETALAALDRLTSGIEFGQKRYDLIEEFESDPILKFRTMPRSDWSGGNGFEFWGLLNYLQEYEQAGGPVTDQINILANDAEEADARNVAKFLLQINEEELSSLTENASFESGNGDAPPWTYWDPNGKATIERVDDTAYTGDSSLSFEGAERSGAYQIFNVEPGYVATKFHYYTPEETLSEEGGVRLVITLQNASGKTLGDYIAPTIPLARTAGEWSSVELFEKIPRKIGGEEVTQVLLNAQVLNAADVQVYMDDVVFYQGEAADEQPIEETNLLTKNSSFEVGNKNADLWGFWTESSTTGTIERVEGVAHTGNASVLIDHMDRGGPHQKFKVKPGPINARVHFYTPQDSVTDGTIQLVLNVKKENGSNLMVYRSDEIPLSLTTGEWSTIELDKTIAASVSGVEVDKVQALVTVNGAQDVEVYVDDFEVRQPREVKELTQNSSFEVGNKNADLWSFWTGSSTMGTIERVEGVAYTGNASILIDHMDRGGPNQTFKVKPGPITARVHFFTPEESITDGTVQLILNLKRESGSNLMVYKSEEIPISLTAGEWTSIELDKTIAATVSGVEVDRVQALLTVDGAQDAQVYVDDFEVWQ